MCGFFYLKSVNRKLMGCFFCIGMQSYLVSGRRFPVFELGEISIILDCPLNFSAL